MPPTITGFKAAPDRGRGLARDVRVRWAFEEVGQAYDVRLLEFAEMKQPAHLALQPFGQIPTYEEGDLKLFDSGAIIFHLAETHSGLFPADPNARARAITWMFTAVSTLEPLAIDLATVLLVEGDKSWRDERLPLVQERIRTRLTQLSAWLGDREWLDGAFSAGDLLMVSVLQRFKPSGLLSETEFPRLDAYIARAESRPAFKRAFDAQYAVFVAAQGTG